MSPSTTSVRHPQEADPSRLQRERVLRFRFWRQLVQEPKAVVGLLILGFFLIVAVFAPLIATHNPTAILGTPWQAPSATYWFGTTDEGQDVFSQWVYGTRTTMVIGLGVGVIGTVISVLIGVYGGYKGGRVDAALNWLTNVMLALPSYPLILVIASYIPDAGSLAITLILGLTSWPAAAR
ncbi:MAG: ABC transporter permease, partial [Firmicutes bacterium]|nr:ABC transporter permease [Bacillota bacterium]